MYRRDVLQHHRLQLVYTCSFERCEEVVRMIYAKGKTIQARFDVGPTVVNQCRRFIAKHPERYGQYGNIVNLTNLAAFCDAYKYRKSKAENLPPFEPNKALMLMGDDNNVWN